MGTERRRSVLRGMVAELVAATVGRFYRAALRGVPDRDWPAFHRALLRALRPVAAIRADRRHPRGPAIPHGNAKRAILADEHRRREPGPGPRGD